MVFVHVEHCMYLFTDMSNHLVFDVIMPSGLESKVDVYKELRSLVTDLLLT